MNLSIPHPLDSVTARAKCFFPTFLYSEHPMLRVWFYLCCWCYFCTISAIDTHSWKRQSLTWSEHEQSHSSTLSDGQIFRQTKTSSSQNDHFLLHPFGPCQMVRLFKNQVPVVVVQQVGGLAEVPELDVDDARVELAQLVPQGRAQAFDGVLGSWVDR